MNYYSFVDNNILNKLENPITNDGLLRLVLSVMDMNYFYFQQFLLDLLENQYIARFDIDGKHTYSITEKGQVNQQIH